MATKLKNFSRAWYIKLIMYVIIAATAAGVLLYVGNRGDYIGLSNLNTSSYDESYDIRNYFYEYGNAALVIGAVEPGMLDINNKEYWDFEKTEDTPVENNSDNSADFTTEPGNEQAENLSQDSVRDNVSGEVDVIEEVEDMSTTDTTTESGTLDETSVEYTVETYTAEDGTQFGESFTQQYDTTVYLTFSIENESIAQKVKDEIRNFYNVWWNEEGQCHLSINHDGYGNLRYKTTYDVDPYKSINLSYSNFLAEHPNMEKTVLSGVLRSMQYDYDRASDTLLQGVEDFGLVYDIVEKDTKELKEKYTALPIYVRMEQNYVTNSSVANLIGNSMDGYYSNNYSLQGKICYLGISNEYYNEHNSQWMQDTATASYMMNAILIGVAVIVVGFIYLAVVTGRRPEEEKVCLYPIDRIWSEVQWTAGSCLGAGIIVILVEVVFDSGTIIANYYMAIVALIVVMGMMLLALILSQIRLFKARKWLDSFICVRIVKKCFDWIKKWIRRIVAGLKCNKISQTAYILAFVLPLLSATWIGVPIVIIFLCFLIYHYLEDFLIICNGAQEIRNGDIYYKIKIKNEDGILKNLAEDINELSEGLKAAVSSELRSERLKAELISNVSHDLKTPLTSIVTYVDLLKQEEIENETAKDYIEVIDRKAKRLTVLTNDLFEAAKASSGDMPVNIETVDLNALVRQALGEFDEKLEKAELNVRLTLPEAPAYVKADGRLTWRVIDNLLNNVVKYGQTGSRVYIEVKEFENTFGFVIKNISAYELNIPADELMERFKRGDESRNSEGSGLGLSIANSLIDLQHGTFKISIDGDLFKAEFELPKSV